MISLYEIVGGKLVFWGKGHIGPTIRDKIDMWKAADRPSRMLVGFRRATRENDGFVFCVNR